MKKVTQVDDEINYCLIWDHKNYPDAIIGNCTKIVPDQTTYNDTQFTEFDLIFILTELKWNTIRRLDFHGFKLAKDLRLNRKIRCPIVFCSFMPGFDKTESNESVILNFPGHYHLQIPNRPLLKKDYHSIDEDTLEDINIYLLNSNKLVYDLIHNIKNRCPELADSIEKINQKYDLEKIKKDVTDYLISQLHIFKKNILPENSKEFDELTTKLIHKIEDTIGRQDFSPEKLRSPLEGLNNQFYNLLPIVEENTTDIKVKKKRWQVLFVDDQQYCCKVIEKHFWRNGITCQTAQNADEAFKVLKADEEGAKVISVVITDFRFYVDGECEAGKWQDLQGYQILNRIHSGYNFKSNYVYVMLTSKKGTIEQYIKKQSKFPILWFNKADVLAGEEHSFNVFCQRIVEVGNDSFLKKHSIPKTGGWKNALRGKITQDFNYKDMYKLHIEDIHYEKNEAKINDLAEKYSQMKELPKGFVLAPSFNRKMKKLDEMLNIFRNTILLYRRIFLILRLETKLKDKELFLFFNSMYEPSSESKYVEEENNKESDLESVKEKRKKIMRKELSLEELQDKQWKDVIRGLFYTNWGFQLEDSSLKEDYLIEEIDLMKKRGNDITNEETQDANNLIEFFYEIINSPWNSVTGSLIKNLNRKLEKGNPNYKEIGKLFSLLCIEMNANKELYHIVLNSCFIKEDYGNNEGELSETLRKLVGSFLEKVK